MDKTEKLTLRECLLGDRAFYRHVLLVVLPIIVQNTLTNVVSLLDNVMVGQVGTLPMSGVAVVGQLLFVYNLAIWGSTSGAGIFGAQFYGRGDMDGVRHTFRFKLLVSTAITAANTASSPRNSPYTPAQQSKSCPGRTGKSTLRLLPCTPGSTTAPHSRPFSAAYHPHSRAKLRAPGTP